MSRLLILLLFPLTASAPITTRTLECAAWQDIWQTELNARDGRPERVYVTSLCSRFEWRQTP